MLIEQRNEIHMQIARLIQKKQVSYLPSLKLEKLNLRKQLENGQKSIIKEMEENPSDNKDNNEILNVQSLKILIVKEICDKLKDIKSNLPDDEIEQIEGKDKLAMALKYGMVDKKSDGKLTWETRFFVLTSKHVSYYYHMDEYISDKVPLATFELKDIFELKQLNDYYYGNKKNLFSVSVSRWIKKEQIKGKRSYIFSCKTLEDLYSWIISINFLRVNAYYDIFTSHFGKIGLPLYRMYKKKPKKFFFNIDEKQMIRNNKVSSSNKDMKSSITASNLKRRISVQQEKIMAMPELKKKVVNLFSKVFLCILGDIQYRLTDFKDEVDEDIKKGIKVPPHLKSCNDLNMQDNNFYISLDDDEEEEKESKEGEEKELIEGGDNLDKTNKEKRSQNSSQKMTMEILRASKKKKTEIEKDSNKDSIKNSNKSLSNKISFKSSKSKEEEKSNKINSDENNKNDGENIISSNKKEANSNSENSSAGQGSKNKEDVIKKSTNSDITDATKKIKIQNNEENNNSFQDFDDIDFEDEDEDENTHIPKFFMKDKNIIQLNDYPELIKDIENNDLRLDFNNAYQQSDI